MLFSANETHPSIITHSPNFCQEKVIVQFAQKNPEIIQDLYAKFFFKNTCNMLFNMLIYNRSEGTKNKRKEVKKNEV